MIKEILEVSQATGISDPGATETEIGPYLDSDQELPHKQQHTAKRVFQWLREE